MKKNYIITGGAGFIGSAIAKELIKKGNKVYILDDLSTGMIKNIPDGALLFRVDISNTKRLRRLKFTQKIDAVFHIAAQPSSEVSFDDPAKDIDVNLKGTFNVLELTCRLKCKRFIYASSMSVYGDAKGKVRESFTCDPTSYYGVNKLASEKLIWIYAKKAGIKATCFRMFNVYGPGQNMSNMRQGMISIYLSYLMKNKPVHVKGGLDRFRDFIYIDDVVGAFLASENNPKTFGQVLNLGTQVSTTVKHLLYSMLSIYGRNNFKKWVYVKGQTDGDVKGFIADISKLKSLLIWKPKIPLLKGLRLMKDWVDGGMK